MVECSAEEMTSRNAWRAILIPAVGSAALSASMIVNILKIHKENGWPKRAFKKSDYLLMAIPFAIIVLAVGEEINKEETKE